VKEMKECTNEKKARALPWPTTSACNVCIRNPTYLLVLVLAGELIAAEEL
jgi:hypothetical protein